MPGDERVDDGDDRAGALERELRADEERDDRRRRRSATRGQRPAAAARRAARAAPSSDRPSRTFEPARPRRCSGKPGERGARSRRRGSPGPASATSRVVEVGVAGPAARAPSRRRRRPCRARRPGRTCPSSTSTKLMQRDRSGGPGEVDPRCRRRRASRSRAPGVGLRPRRSGSVSRSCELEAACAGCGRRGRCRYVRDRRHRLLYASPSPPPKISVGRRCSTSVVASTTSARRRRTASTSCVVGLLGSPLGLGELDVVGDHLRARLASGCGSPSRGRARLNGHVRLRRLGERLVVDRDEHDVRRRRLAAADRRSAG